ncbi:uncharacterized protein LOC120251431 [Dioscorea cayenensis subsp. rotundata]|uniref:Uncharacterized protein LOC120251431 n=1 Tax=Dioscorea cayennensis subsp. rotundata TaxID=55577 RepID=A0AB40ALR4_DIOCR|nr:uncharacterized protein LOC120251431 [Dioscorea cayenensis subsp. rotundata]
MEELDGGSWVFRARFSSMAFPRLDTVKLSENLLSTEQRWNLYKFCLDLKMKNSTSLSETTSFTPESNASSSSSPATSSNDLDQKLKNLDIDSSESKPTTSRKTDHDTRKSNLFLNKNERRSKGGNRRSVSPLGSTELSDTFKEESRSHGKRFFLLPLRRHRSQNKSVSKDDLVQHATRATSRSSMEKKKGKNENSCSTCFDAGVGKVMAVEDIDRMLISWLSSVVEGSRETMEDTIAMLRQSTEALGISGVEYGGDPLAGADHDLLSD